MEDELLAIRHHLHSHPELSFHEEKTAAFLSGLLTEWGIEHQKGVGGHGIVGIINGFNPTAKVIALRADMDALPIVEQNRVPYKSMNAGVMHACGHDVHMTCLLGVIKFLNQWKTHWEGRVKFIFQPAEEQLPGGAIKMIEAGVLDRPKPKVIFAQHVFPELPAGKVGFRSGRYMASSDEVNLIVRGKGGHAAMPENYDNTVLAAAQILIDLQQQIEQAKPSHIPSVLAFGKIVADGAHNVIPSQVSIHGTFRTFDEEWRKKAHHLIETTAQSAAAKYHTQCELALDRGYPVLINDPAATSLAKKAAVEFLGTENVVELNQRMTVEDFARYGQVVPACFYRLGTGNPERGITANLHTPMFDVDESSLVTGTGMMLWISLKSLQSN